MNATHPDSRRSLIALAAAALATISIAIPVRLVAEDLNFGGAGKTRTEVRPAPAPVTVQHSPQAKPDWIKDPLAPPLQQLEAPVAPTTRMAR
jgi:hypothetical protein